MEYNIYGVHQIDFSTLLSIQFEDKSHVLHLLNMSDLTDAMKKGEIPVLDQAMTKFSFLFSSHRFVDYLISLTDHVEMREKLQEIRKHCDLPFWMNKTKRLFSSAGSGLNSTILDYESQEKNMLNKIHTH